MPGKPPQSQVQIRYPKPEEFGTIMGFRHQTARASFPGAKINRNMLESNIMRMMESDPESVMVADEAGAIIGCVAMKRKGTLSGKTGVVEHIFVEKGSRGRGIAKVLMKAVEERLKKEGIRKVRATVTISNNPSLKMFRSLGYNKRRVVLEKNIR